MRCTLFGSSGFCPVPNSVPLGGHERLEEGEIGRCPEVTLTVLRLAAILFVVSSVTEDLIGPLRLPSRILQTQNPSRLVTPQLQNPIHVRTWSRRRLLSSCHPVGCADNFLLRLSLNLSDRNETSSSKLEASGPCGPSLGRVAACRWCWPWSQQGTSILVESVVCCFLELPFIGLKFACNFYSAAALEEWR